MCGGVTVQNRRPKRPPSPAHHLPPHPRSHSPAREHPPWRSPPGARARGGQGGMAHRTARAAARAHRSRARRAPSACARSAAPAGPPTPRTPAAAAPPPAPPRPPRRPRRPQNPAPAPPWRPPLPWSARLSEFFFPLFFRVSKINFGGVPGAAPPGFPPSPPPPHLAFPQPLGVLDSPSLVFPVQARTSPPPRFAFPRLRHTAPVKLRTPGPRASEGAALRTTRPRFLFRREPEKAPRFGGASEDPDGGPKEVPPRAERPRRVPRLHLQCHPTGSGALPSPSFVNG